MRQRERLVIHKEHGVSMTTEIIDDDADFAQRARELKATLPDTGPAGAGAAAVICNGCGTSASVDFDNPRLPGGWVSCAEGDFCPRCLGGAPN